MLQRDHFGFFLPLPGIMRLSKTSVGCGNIYKPLFSFAFLPHYPLAWLLLIHTSSTHLLIKVMLPLTLGVCYFSELDGILTRCHRLFIGGQWVDPVDKENIELVLFSSSIHLLVSYFTPPKCH